MKYMEEIHLAQEDPKTMEELYQRALGESGLDEFVSDLVACYEAAPENLLYQAWYYRLAGERERRESEGMRWAHWKTAIPLAIANGLIFWLLSDENLEFLDYLPYIFLLWAPIAASFVMGFLSLGAPEHHRRYALVSAVLVGLALYVLLVARGQDSLYYHDYLNLMVVHLPLLAWIGVGFSVLGRGAARENHFAFLIKSFEVFITVGVYLIAGGAFAGVTIGMFEALGITIPEIFFRLIFAGGGGLIPVLAVTSLYDPGLRPVEQDFSLGLSRFVATMMRLLLPLTLVVQVIYLFVIPFNFMEPFRNREVLIIYNVMLFAIMGLLIGATPVETSGLSPRFQKALHYGILAIAILTVLVSLYAMSATVYRTIQGGITINRLTIIGWNTINIAILVLLIYRQRRTTAENWAEGLKTGFQVGTLGYAFWALFTLIFIPIFFR